MFTDSISQRKNDSLQKWPKTLWPKTLYYNTIYVAKFLGSPTIPFSFNGIEYIKGSFQVDPVISIGFGYTLFTGDFIFNEIDKITVDQKLFFGIAAHIGLQENFDLSKLANIFSGAFIGFGSYALFIGYDFISKSPSLGLGGKVDLYVISQNFLKPIGKVRELRRHKKFAIPIEYE